MTVHENKNASSEMNSIHCAASFHSFLFTCCFVKPNEFNCDALSNTVARFFSHFCYCFACRATAFDRASPLNSSPFSRGPEGSDNQAYSHCF